jgi:outer membrane protein assembly factor BamD (BamD/ComL family)
MIITKFKTYTWRVFAVYMYFFTGFKFTAAQSPVKAADISLSQLISFQNRDISHFELAMSNKSGWNINYRQNQQSFEIRNVGNVNCLNEGWITGAYVAGINYFQTLDFYQVLNGQSIILYRTNSLKKYEELLNQFTIKTIAKSDEFENLLGNSSRVQRLSGGFSWEYAIEDIEYETGKRYTILLYKTSLVSYVKARIAWENVENDGYEVESLIQYIAEYPKAFNIGLAKSKLEEKRYQTAYSGGSVETINQFLADYPQSKHVGILKTKAEDLQYEQMCSDESQFNELNIDKFIAMYPNSRYVKGLEQKKEESKFNSLLLSGDEGLIYIQYVAEKDLKKRGMMLSAIQKIRYQKVIDSIEYMSTNLQKIAIINVKINDFNGTVYFDDLEKKLHQLEYELLPKALGEKCDDWQRFVQRYPNSIYASDAKVHAQKCLEQVERNKILDSAWQVYYLLSPNDYSNLISTGEFILNVSVENNKELQSQIIALKKTYAFIKERRYKSYALNEINPNLYASHYGLIERQIINNVDGLRNAVFNSSLTFNTDTFGKSKVKVIGSNSRFFETEIAGKLTNDIGGLNYFQLLPVMTTETHNIRYSSQSNSFELFRVRKGNFQLTKKTIPATGYNTILSLMNGDRNYFKSGRYRIVWDEVHINNKIVNLMSIENYRSFTGVSAILPAIVVPGWGTRLVRGKKGNAWITVSTYGMAAVGTYFAIQAQQSYENYLSATAQNEMDQKYDQYLNQRSKSLFSFAGAVGIYSLNLTYVIFKGMGNSIKTASYRNRYKNYSKEFN